MEIDIKLIFAILASVAIWIGMVPYLRDIFSGQTKPHIYTWIIWLITQGTATAGVLYGGGGWGALALLTGVIAVALVLVLSIKKGTKNITKSDTLALFGALAAVVVWWQLENPLAAVLMVALIDGIGYIPTYRKSFQEPYSETISFWFFAFLASILTFASLTEYNLLTVAYVAVITIANGALFLLLPIWRRRTNDKPVDNSV